MIGMRALECQNLKKSKASALHSWKMTITAATSSPVSIGASAILITSRTYAEKNSIQIKAAIKGRSLVGVDWRRMGMGPLPAENVLKSLDMTMNDIDVIELNEAFSAQALYVIKKEDGMLAK